MTDYEIYALQSYKDHVFEDTRPTRKASVDDLNQLRSGLSIVKKYNNKR